MGTYQRIVAGNVCIVLKHRNRNMPGEARSDVRRRLSAAEHFIKKYAEDIIGPEKTHTLLQEEYKPYWKAGSILLVGLLLVSGVFGQLISNLVGFLYPAYVSFKAIESHRKDDDTKWLTYWTVFGVLSVLDSFADVLLQIIPFYWLAKSVFLAWCFAPIDANGSGVIYRNVVKPFFLKHEKKIDSAATEVRNLAESYINGGATTTTDSDSYEQFQADV